MYNLYLFKILNASNINIQQIFIQGDKLFKNIEYNYASCNENINDYSFFAIQEFKSIFFKNITVQNFIIFDSLLFEIIKNTQTQDSSEITSIVFEDIKFKQIQIFKQSAKSKNALIYIYSQIEYLIQFNWISFEKNIYVQNSPEIQGYLSFLIYIECQYCIIEFNDLYCNKNFLTNSTNSFIKIIANTLSINRYFVMYHNFVPLEDFKIFVDFDFSIDLDQSQANSIFNQIYGIKNRGSAGVFITNIISIKNGHFANLIAQNTPLFEITTFQQGVIQFVNLTIFQIELLDSSSQELKGSISINAVDSLLRLEIINCSFSEIFQHTNSPIFYILPSNTQNQIIQQNVQFNNSFSRNNLILSFNLDSIQNDSFVEINNASIFQDLKVYKRFIKQTSKQTLIDFTSNLRKNSLIEISGYSLIINNLHVQGVVLAQILNAQNTPKLKLSNSKFVEIKQIITSILVEISSTVYTSSFAIIYNCIFKNISYYNLIDEEVEHNYVVQIILSYEICDGEFEVSYFNEIFSISQLFKQQSINENGAIIYFSNLHQKVKTNLINIQLINNECQYFQNGGIYFQLIQTSKLLIKEFTCYKNNFKSFGCLVINSTVLNNNFLQIFDSKFFENKAQNGAALYISQINFQIKNCYFINNQVSENGGAIFIQNLGENSKFISSFIISNKANIGGGLYLKSGQTAIDHNIIKQTLLKFNSASYYGNNLVDLPDHLQLNINGQEFPSEIRNNNQELVIKSYSIIEQGNKIQTKFLMIPSGQEIAVFKLFNPKSMDFHYYIQQFLFTFRNILNEKLNDQEGSKCLIWQTILDRNFQEISDQNLVYVLEFNQNQKGFDFSKLQFSMDPFSKELIRILLNCTDNRENNNQNISYSIIFKTFKCQLGEYYQNEECQICEPLHGFYAVNYNVSKCSMFQNEKFDAITSNTIQLKLGFWRPNIYSDFTEYCYKDPELCKGGWGVGNDICQNGHIGALCEECDIYNIQGYGKYCKIQKKNCVICETTVQGIFSSLMLITWSILSLFITLKSVNKSKQLYRILLMNSKFGKIIFKFDQDYSGFILKLLLNYLWIFSVVFSFNINFQYNFSFVDQASNSSYFFVSNFDCYLSENFNIDLIYLRILANYFIILAIFFITNFIIMLQGIIQNTKFDFSILTNCLLYLFIQNNSTLSQQFSSIISSRTISNINFIYGDVSLQYESQTHYLWLYYFILPNFFVIILLTPVFLVLFLSIHKNDLEKIIFRNHFGYLFNEYISNCFYWEQVKTWKKVIIIIIISYYENNAITKVCLLGICLMLYHYNQTRIQPFITKSLNKLDFESLQYCSLSIFIAGMQQQNDQTGNLQITWILYIIQFILFLKMSFPYFCWFYNQYIKKNQIAIFIQLEILLRFLHLYAFSNVVFYYVKKLKLKKSTLLKNIKHLQSRFIKSKNNKILEKLKISKSIQ